MMFIVVPSSEIYCFEQFQMTEHMSLSKACMSELYPTELSRLALLVNHWQLKSKVPFSNRDLDIFHQVENTTHICVVLKYISYIIFIGNLT